MLSRGKAQPARAPTTCEPWFMDNHPKGKVASQLTRRAFIKGAGAAAVAAGISAVSKPPGGAADSAETVGATIGAGVAERLGPEAVTLELTVNGMVRQVTVEPRVTLL